MVDLRYSLLGHYSHNVTRPDSLIWEHYHLTWFSCLTYIFSYWNKTSKGFFINQTDFINWDCLFTIMLHVILMDDYFFPFTYFFISILLNNINLKFSLLGIFTFCAYSIPIFYLIQRWTNSIRFLIGISCFKISNLLEYIRAHYLGWWKSKG